MHAHTIAEHLRQGLAKARAKLEIAERGADALAMLGGNQGHRHEPLRLSHRLALRKMHDVDGRHVCGHQLLDLLANRLRRIGEVQGYWPDGVVDHGYRPARTLLEVLDEQARVSKRCREQDLLGLWEVE